MPAVQILVQATSNFRPTILVLQFWQQLLCCVTNNLIFWKCKVEWMRKRLFFYRDTNRYIPKKRAMRRPHLHNFLKRDIARRFFEKEKKMETTKPDIRAKK